jgi:hypothetical protein
VPALQQVGWNILGQAPFDLCSALRSLPVASANRQGNCMSSSESTELEMHFSAIDEAKAERLLAAIWCALEEYGIPTPLIEVRSARASVNITLRFRTAEGRALVDKLHIAPDGSLL